MPVFWTGTLLSKVCLVRLGWGYTEAEEKASQKRQQLWLIKVLVASTRSLFLHGRLETRPLPVLAPSCLNSTRKAGNIEVLGTWEVELHAPLVAIPKHDREHSRVDDEPAPGL